MSICSFKLNTDDTNIKPEKPKEQIDLIIEQTFNEFISKILQEIRKNIEMENNKVKVVCKNIVTIKGTHEYSGWDVDLKKFNKAFKDTFDENKFMNKFNSENNGKIRINEIKFYSEESDNVSHPMNQGTNYELSCYITLDGFHKFPLNDYKLRL